MFLYDDDEGEFMHTDDDAKLSNLRWQQLHPETFEKLF